MRCRARVSRLDFTAEPTDNTLHSDDMAHMTLPTATLLSALLVLALSGCGSVPYDYPRTSSSRVPPQDDTHWGQLDAEWEHVHGALSGFMPLPEGMHALAARLRLMERAEQSIDAQYFILKKDRAGGLFASGLLQAADRGVRVRLLVDDIFSPGVDHPFSLLASHPNIEVRLFNPLSRQGLKYVNFVTDFRRANRRMHNKSFTVDNALSIVGGRNIGEEYFELNQDVKFDDFEVLTIGPVVDAISEGFDLFWNSELAIPIEAFGRGATAQERQRWREGIDSLLRSPHNSLFRQVIDTPLLSRPAGTHHPFVPAPASLVTDRPEKLTHPVGAAELETLGREIDRRMADAQHEVIIITPYFIPQAPGMQRLESLLARGVRVIIITNSLASTNHIPVYGAYRRYRKELLAAGAEIYEVRADGTHGTNAWGNSPEKLTLHSKFAMLDGEVIFVGSLNFDPRSIVVNSEMGLFIESPALGHMLRAGIEDEMRRVLYRVELDAGGRLRWRHTEGGSETVHTSPPLSSWWRRLKATLYGWLPIENQL